MSDTSAVLTRKSLMIIFTYATAGLGHLRVTYALYQSLPPQSNPILFASPEGSISFMHRFTSINPAARSVMEWLQSGKQEELFTRTYRSFLRRGSQHLYEHIQMLLDGPFNPPEMVLLVATHFGLAHQLAAIKDRLSQTRGIKVVLVVQVTDDSPQRIWYVAGADLIVVPSQHTQADLEQYGQAEGLPPVRFAVLPYPVGPNLTELLSVGDQDRRRQQLLADSQSEIHMAVPISGAAVGLNYYRTLIDELHRKSSRFRFHIIAKTSPYTQPFLQELSASPHVTLHMASTDRAIVERYEQVFRNAVIALEVTKPSEQTFKALASPNRRGGAILLFSSPVGRQEYDNLAFLRRHRLLTTVAEQGLLWKQAESEAGPVDTEAGLLDQARLWRGVRLADDPSQAAQYIWWSLQRGFFEQMFQCTLTPRAGDEQPQELSSDGVTQFWQIVSGLLST